MLAPAWTWWGLGPVLLVAFGVLYAPGLVALTTLRVRAWMVLALAPLVSVCLVSAGGVLFWAAHLPWTALTFGVLAMLLLGVAFVVGRHRGPWRRPDTEDVRGLAGVGLGAVIIGATYIRAAGRPGNFPQNPDFIFHLDLARWFLEHHSASSLDASLGVGPALQFYPAALHGLAALVMQLTGAPAVIAFTALQLLLLGLAWPASLIALTQTCFTRRQWTPLLAGALACGLQIFPFRLLGFGPLWPFDAALALSPAWLALLVMASRPPHGHVAWRPLLLAAALSPGLALLHAGVAMSLVIPASFLAIEWAFIRRRARSAVGAWGVRVAAIALLPMLVAMGALKGPEAMKQVTSVKPVPWQSAQLLALQLWNGGSPSATLAGLAVMGLALLGVGAQVRARTAWLPATAAAFWGLALGLDVLGTNAARWLYWPWQNVSERIRATAGLFVLALAVVGATVLVRLLRTHAHRVAAGTVAVVMPLGIAGVSSDAAGAMLIPYFDGRANPPAMLPWLTPEEATALETVSGVLPDDAVVVADPWRGGTFLAQIGPEHLLLPTEKTNSPELQYAVDHLDAAATDARVCHTLTTRGVRYAMTGGQVAQRIGRPSYPAFDRLPKARGFTVVTVAEPYTLYRIDACL